MPSRAHEKYLEAEKLARILRNTAKDPRLRPISSTVKQKYFHASLAAYVAGWDNYIKSVVREYNSRITDPLDVKYSQVHSVASKMSERVLHKLNTPDRDNARDALLICTGYDPIGDWVWQKASLSAIEVKEFLGEIFKVRHSFAHGFDLPSFDWTSTTGGRKQLTDHALQRVEAFLRHLVKRTDKGLCRHASIFFPGAPIW